MNALELIRFCWSSPPGWWASRTRLKVPYPILLVLGGLALAFIPGLPRVDINPELVLLVFLPPLLFGAAWFTSWRDFAANKRAIGLLAIGLVVATTTAVAWVAHAVIPGMSWPVAFVLGAIVSPPDAVAATAVTQRLKVPRRIITILEGESLVNDATGLVAYKFALAAVATGSFSPAAAAGRFVLVAVGGIAVGFTVGWLVAQIHRRMEHFEIETVITLLTPYAAYIPAEHFGVSGVLATVTAGGYLGWRNPELLSALTRFRGRGVWSVLMLLFNGLVFVLIGLQLATIRDIISDVSFGSLLGWSAAVSGVAIVVRMIYVPLRDLRPRADQPQALHHREPVVAQRDPHRVDGDARDRLAGAGPGPAAHAAVGRALPAPGDDPGGLLRGDPGDPAVAGAEPAGRHPGPGAQGRRRRSPREEREALLLAAEAAVARLGEIDQTSIVHPQLMARVQLPYQQRIERLSEQTRDDPECRLTEGEEAAFRKLRGEALNTERKVAVALRNQGRISEEVLHRVQEALDLEALQPER